MITIIWLALLAIVVLLEIVGRQLRAFAPPSAVLRSCSGRPIGRVALFFFWAFVGLHLFARYTVPIH